MGDMRSIAVELDAGQWLRVIASDVGVRGAGRQRVNADVNVGHAWTGGKRRCRDDARELWSRQRDGPRFYADVGAIVAQRCSQRLLRRWGRS